MSTDNTRSDSDLGPHAPDGGVIADAMRAAIASELFGAAASGPLRVGRYEVQEALGEGGMGVVYAARDPQLGRRVALKLLTPHASHDPRRRDRMVREAQALAKLSHPNVVHVYEVGEHEDRIYVSMELVEGISLKEWLEAEDRDLNSIQEVFSQAGAGLAAAHAADLVHRDFKPSNVMVGVDGRVRVLDFGLARGSGLSTNSSGPVLESTTSEEATKTGTVMGTPAYMAPEQIRGEVADARADQFSFCVALYEALAKTRPYDFRELRRNQSTARLSNTSAVPRMWRSVLRRGLSIAPPDRWPTMNALLAAVQRASRRRALAPWIGVALLGLPASGLLAASGTTEDQCANLPRSLGIWSPARATELSEMFARTGAPYASDVWTTAQADIEVFAEGWLAARTEVCAGAKNPVGRACLARAQTVFGTILDEYQSVDRDNVHEIHELSALLESPKLCASAPSTAFEQGVEIQHLSTLSSALAATRVHHTDEALDILDELVSDPKLGGTDALAEAHRLRGRALGIEGDFDSAFAATARARALAHSPTVRRAAAVDWIRLLHQSEEVKAMRAEVRALPAFVDELSPASARAELWELRGLVEMSEAPMTAVSHLEKALELRQEAGVKPLLVRTRMALGHALSASGDERMLDRAESIYRSQVQELQAWLGPKHPWVAAAKYNLAVLLCDQRADYEQALRFLRTADEIEGITLRETDPVRARTRLKTGEALLRLGQTDEAGLMLRAAWSTLRSTPPENSDHVAARTLLADYTLSTEDYASSLKHHEALARLSPSSAPIHANIGQIHIKLGHPALAREAANRASGVVALLSFDGDPRRLFRLSLDALHAEAAALEGRHDLAAELADEVLKQARELELPDFMEPNREQLIVALEGLRESAQRP